MTNALVGNAQAILEGMGFKGELLKHMMVLVKCERDLEELDAFIINNDSLSTALSISNAYRMDKIKNEQISLSQFKTSYHYTVSDDERKRCLEWLSKGYIEKRWASDLQKKLQRGDTTLEDFYKAFSENPLLHIRRLIVEAVSFSQGLDW